jgi:hypothetical protein
MIGRKMSQELGILFLHHDTNAVVLNNLRSARRQNPQSLVVTMSAGKALGGGYSLAATPVFQRLHAKNVKRSSDWLVCSWYAQHRERCKKWWIIEWDTYCGMSAQEYYRPVWKYPFVASSVQLRNREPGWAWFYAVKQMPREYQPYATGAVPFLYLVSIAALAAICETLIAAPFTAGNGELRFATAANRCGFPPCGFSPPNDQITHINHSQPITQPTISHPVKFYARLKSK